MTDASGRCSFTYSGPALPGADLISAYADTNNSSVQDAGEPGGEATKAWVLPGSTPGQASGGGHIEDSAGNKIAFGFSAKSDGGLKGGCTVVDQAADRIKCQDVTSFVITGNQATIYGNATDSGVATTYVIKATDNANPGKGGTPSRSRRGAATAGPACSPPETSRSAEPLARERRFQVGKPARRWPRSARRKAMDNATARQELELAKAAEVGLNGPESTTWLQRLDDSHDDREQAFAWFLEHDPQHGLEMAAALLGYWNTRALYDEGRRWSDALLTRAPERTLPRAKALYGAGVIAFRQGHTEQTRALTEESLAIAREVEDPGTVVQALAGLGRVGLREGDYRRVKELNREALDIATKQGDKAMRRLPLHLLAEATRLDGDYPGARALYEESLALAVELGNENMIVTELTNLGAVELHEGHREEAQANWEETVRRTHERGDVYALPYAMAGLGELAAARADWERAATLLAATESLFEASGAVMDPADVAPYDAAVAATRSALTDEAFRSAWTRGRLLDRDAAVRTALGERVSA